MSYILDALKQSERRRGRQIPVAEIPVTAETPSLQQTPRYRRRLWCLPAGVLLALMLGYGLGKIGSTWLQSPSQSINGPSPATRDPEKSPPTQLPATATRAPIAIGSAPVRILLDDPPALTMNPSLSASNTVTPTTEGPRSDPVISPQPEVVVEPIFDPGVPDLRELPASIRAKLPTLTLSVHIYSKTASRRMVNINRQMVREGQKIGAVQLQTITPTGVILNFEGQAFHLTSIGG